MVGDAVERVRSLPRDAADCVITDPVWPNAPPGMFPECSHPHKLLADTLAVVPDSVKRVVIVLRHDSDPRFLTAVPSKWPFFHMAWLSYAMPGRYGRKLGGRELAYCFGEPVPSRPGRHLISGVCKKMVKPKKANGVPEHPSARALQHMEFVVKWWSDEGETILDPFCGSGTIGLAADKLGRNAILIDINEDYAALAERRIRDATPMFSKVELERQ